MWAERTARKAPGAGPGVGDGAGSTRWGWDRGWGWGMGDGDGAGGVQLDVRLEGVIITPAAYRLHVLEHSPDVHPGCAFVLPSPYFTPPAGLPTRRSGLCPTARMAAGANAAEAAPPTAEAADGDAIGLMSSAPTL